MLSPMINVLRDGGPTMGRSPGRDTGNGTHEIKTGDEEPEIRDRPNNAQEQGMQERQKGKGAGEIP